MGCSPSIKHSDIPQAKITSNLLAECPDIPLLKNGKSETLLPFTVKLAGAYRLCKVGKKNLIRAVNKKQEK